MSTAKGSPPLPEDVLVIRYADLSLDPLTRLQTAAAIGKLLDGESQRLSELSSSPTSAHALQAWLENEQTKRFWRLDGGTIVVEAPCEKHLLVGTALLLQDLGNLGDLAHAPSFPELGEIELVWQAAKRLTEQSSME